MPDRPTRPHEIYSEWLGRLPFWTAVANAWPLHLLNASEDDKDAWVRERWAASQETAHNEAPA